jgi:outer membrane protein OmpA-like peptidoglycan-associated protein
MRGSGPLALAVLGLLAACGARPVKAPPPSELVVVLPEAGGKVGTVVVRHAGGEHVLHHAYAASREVPGKGREAVTMNQAEVDRVFAAALKALPPAPATYLLYFLEGRTELTAESKADLDKMLTEIPVRPAPEVLIVGHTDAVGTDGFNDTLSVQRAERVRADILARGVAKDRVHAAGRGKRELLYASGDGVPEPRNRRVEISVR